jgi:hypothetical protein
MKSLKNHQSLLLITEEGVLPMNKCRNGRNLTERTRLKILLFYYRTALLSITSYQHTLSLFVGGLMSYLRYLCFLGI